MKITRWGRSGKFPKPQKACTAVVIPHYDGNFKVSYQWVTTLWYEGRKEWRCENHKKAFLWNNKRDAEDFVSLLSWHGQAAWTVTVFPDCIPENNW